MWLACSSEVDGLDRRRILAGATGEAVMSKIAICPTCSNSEGEGPGVVTHYFKGQEQYKCKCSDPWHTSAPPAPAEKFAPISIDPNLRNTNWPTGESASTAPAAQQTVQTVDSDEHITLIVGPSVRSIYGDSAELGHYKLAIAVYKMAMTAAVDVTASICMEVARLEKERDAERLAHEEIANILLPLVGTDD